MAKAPETGKPDIQPVPPALGAPTPPNNQPQRAWRWRRWIRPQITSEAMVASIAVMLSLVTLATTAWIALRGSVVTAVPPNAVFFYRDAVEGAGAVLTAGVDTSLVNSASANYGDVLTSITMEIDQPGPDDPSFNYVVLLTPVFSQIADRQAENCPVTARCVVNDRQFLVIEEPRRTLDVPGGASRSEYVGFVLQSTNCTRSGECEQFADFETVSRLLEAQDTLIVRFRYQLHSDGERVATCRMNLRSQPGGPYVPWLADHLNDKGWVMLPCLPSH